MFVVDFKSMLCAANSLYQQCLQEQFATDILALYIQEMNTIFSTFCGSAGTSYNQLDIEGTCS